MSNTDKTKISWRRSVAALLLGGSIVLIHWLYVVGADDFVVLRPFKSGFAEVNMGSVVVDEGALIIPMPDGSWQVVADGDTIGYKVFKYGFPFSYKTCSEQLPMCTPMWQIPVRIGLNVALLSAACFGVLSWLSLIRTHWKR